MKEININFTPFPNLETRRLKLRQFQAGDADAIFRMRSDKATMQYIGKPVMESLSEAEEFIELIRKGVKNNENISWAITESSNDYLIGTIVIWHIVPYNFRAEIGYMLNKSFHGQGYMAEAVEKVLDYGFYTMNLHSMEAYVNPENQRSIRLVEKFNFVKEAHLRENVFFAGKFLDTAIYSLINPEK